MQTYINSLEYNNYTFTKRDYNRTWCIEPFKSLFNLLTKRYNVSISDGTYGVDEFVPLMFFESIDKNGKPIPISYTPYGKVVFLNFDQVPLFDLKDNTGILIPYCELKHNAKTCIATINKAPETKSQNDCVLIPSRLVYKELFTNRRIASIKAMRTIGNLELKEAKNYVDTCWNLIGRGTLQDTNGLGDTTYTPIVDIQAMEDVLVTQFKPMSKIVFPANGGTGFNSPQISRLGNKPTPAVVDMLEAEIKRLHKIAKERTDAYEYMKQRRESAVQKIAETKSRLDNELSSSRHMRMEYNNMETELNEIRDELINVMEDLIIERNSTSNTSTTTIDSTLNIWDILECHPQTEKDIIKVKVMDAIKKYHPDRVAMAGSLLQNYANNITKEVLEFKKSMK